MCVLNDWISSNDEICTDNCNYFRFKLKGNGRSEFWEVYLCGVRTINVDRDRTQVLPRRVSSPSIGDVGFGPFTQAGTDHTIYELNLPSKCSLRTNMNMADPVPSEKYGGT